MATEQKSARTLRLAAIGAAVLAIAGVAAFTFALKHARAPQASGTVKVTIRANACDPNALTVPAGKSTFLVENASERTVEWEILDGVMVVEEKENILPGFTQTLTANLAPGAYQMTCGLLTNPQGAITVTASADSAGTSAKPDDKVFLGAIAEYKVFLRLNAATLAAETHKLADAITAGDLAGAKALYPQIRQDYGKIASVMLRLSDAESTINPFADDLGKREDDPAFTGFHRIEYSLFAKSSLDGLAPIAAKLAADVDGLGDRLKAAKVQPSDLAANASKLAARMADRQVPNGENKYAGSDLTEFHGNLLGIGKLVSLLKPALAASPETASDLDAKLAAANAAVDATMVDGQYPSYGTIDKTGRDKLAAVFTALADALAKANASLGLN
ncbi:iron uptake system protein EfeO [Aestuariivirga sp.]|uniref:iron uptake system protein EfeO n=1 Tax=Aestuariivirga sp. TaxID=2650926 RepID=UPI0039E3566F